MSPNSCLIQIGRNKFRSLVDSAAEVSLMHTRVYQSLKKKPPLVRKIANLQSVSGTCLKHDGYVTLSFKIGDTEIKHSFFVSPSINRNFILGRDWLVQNGVRLYFDLGFLRIGNTQVPLEEDIIFLSWLD